MSNIIQVKSSDISIVIQGPLYKRGKSEKHKGIMQAWPTIKKYFPESEIIISTWEGEDTEGIEADKIIYSKLPQSFPDINRSTRNFNRQIVSTKNGILEATKPFVLKTRSDMLFKSANIAQVSQPKLNSFFKYPVTMPSMVFRNHLKIPFLFHPSDVIQFGLKEDILDLWDIPLEELNEIVTNGKQNIFFRYTSTCFKYHPEQSLCIRWLKKHGVEINLQTPSELSPRLLRTWEETVVHNFHILNYENSGIEFPPHFYNSAYGKSSLMTNSDVKKISTQIKKNEVQQNLRYGMIWFNKYALGFTRKTFVLALVANILYVFFPSLNQKIFTLYRKIRPR